MDEALLWEHVKAVEQTALHYQKRLIEKDASLLKLQADNENLATQIDHMKKKLAESVEDHTYVYEELKATRKQLAGA